MVRVMVPKDVHMLIFGTNKCVTFQGEGDFAGMIKLWSLRWGDYPCSSGGGSDIITRVLIREGGNQESKRAREAPEDALLLALKIFKLFKLFKYRGKGHDPRNTGDL